MAHSLFLAEWFHCTDTPPSNPYVRLLMDILVLSTLGILGIKLLRIFMHKSLYVDICLFLLAEMMEMMG